MTHRLAADSPAARLFFPARGLGLAFAALVAAGTAQAQLFTNLQSLVYQLRTGDPSIAQPTDGPKGIGTGDFDEDGEPDLATSNTDGSVTVYFGRGGGRFGQPKHLRTGGADLRGIVCADLDGDGRSDIATACPRTGLVYLFYAQANRTFSAAVLEGWSGVRNLAAGDFDGDGRMDLVAAGPNNGLRHFRGLAQGWQVATNLAPLSVPNTETNEYKPVYAMKVYRPAGQDRDRLVVTHADTTTVWWLDAGPGGALRITGTLTTDEGVYSLDVGPILHSLSSGGDDLVVVQRDAGTLEIHQGGHGLVPFAQPVSQRIDIPGGPRAVRLEDLDRDGWNDLVVVVRNFDSVLTFRNSNGVFVAATERPVGLSPREMTAADFNHDGFPDVAVMNRASADVNVLLTYPGNVGFTAVDHVYLVEGEVVGLSVFDFNHDGRDDVIQLHRASGEFSVRLAGPDGTLASPEYYTVGQVPGSQVIVDVNNDGRPDQATANLGAEGVESGFVSVRLGLNDGMFGSEQRFYLSNATEQIVGRLFALVAGDFDSPPDGNIDLAAGFLDNRIAFFQGNGNGTFSYTRSHEFLQEARALVAGDFDRDGDLDLAGVGVGSELAVIENTGDLLITTHLSTVTYPPPSFASFGARALQIVDLDGDNDLDLVLGSGGGALVYRGSAGVSFQLQPDALPGAQFPVSSVASADLDHDGSDELVLACRVLDCVTILTRTPDGYAPTLTVDVPSSRFLATGDLDGDGQADLIGSGRLLWTALSSRAPTVVPPLRRTGNRGQLAHPVINEFLAINSSRPVDLDDGRKSDWIEIFNGTNRVISLAGWTLRTVARETEGEIKTNQFHFPTTATLLPGFHLLVICSTNVRTVYHTGFKLPGGGGTLALVDSAGEEVDRVEYPAQQENISYARYRDALPSFVFNPFPSPLRSNPDNGRVGPNVRFEGVDPFSLGAGRPLCFLATVRDDVGIASASMLVQRLDQPNSVVQRVVLHDDGRHGDGAAHDHLFGGELDGGLVASGAEYQFFLEVVDLSEQVALVPEDATFGRPGEPGNSFRIAVDGPVPPLEISEIVALNELSFVLTNDLGEISPDWVEVRNISAQPVPLDGLAILRHVGDNDVYFFPTNDMLAPGEHTLVFCDNIEPSTAYEAPFHLKASGDQLLLIGFTTNGSIKLVDGVRFGAMAKDVAWARLGVGGSWRYTTPTPYAGNLLEPEWSVSSLSQGMFRLAFPTEPHARYTVEQTATLWPPAWTALPPVPGYGIELVFTWPATNQCFFRVRKEAW